MKHALLLSICLLFTACSTAPDVPESRDNNTKNKILANQYEATHAQNEYKKLQEQREKV
jgi:starvation-inducible outer membrane lipoprotein